jgi:hypothetical protein
MDWESDEEEAEVEEADEDAEDGSAESDMEWNQVRAEVVGGSERKGCRSAERGRLVGDQKFWGKARKAHLTFIIQSGFCWAEHPSVHLPIQSQSFSESCDVDKDVEKNLIEQSKPNENKIGPGIHSKK